jgi:hypothetical protein
MPIRPEMRSRYPHDWKLRSHFVRFVRARGRCEWCGAAHGEPHPVTGSIVVLTPRTYSISARKRRAFSTWRRFASAAITATMPRPAVQVSARVGKRQALSCASSKPATW